LILKREKCAESRAGLRKARFQNQNPKVNLTTSIVIVIGVFKSDGLAAPTVGTEKFY
jgi:hypothetical protein